MIPFGLSSLMTVSLPIVRRLAKCPDSVFAHLRATEANADLVEASGYAAISTANGNFTCGTGGAGRFYLNNDQQSRIRQAGSVTGVQMFVAGGAGTLTELWIYIWRKNGATWDIVGRENIVSKVTRGQTNTVTLTTPIAVQVGDYVGAGGVGSSTPFTALTGYPANACYYGDMTAPTESTNWAALSNSTAWIPIKVLMQAPVVVMIGDSVTAGHPANYSYIESTRTEDATSDPARLITAATGCSAQNMGIGSQTSTHLAARFAADVVALKPKACVIQVGLNDIAGGASQATYLANMTAMLDACETAGIVPIVVRLPWTAGSDEQNATYDTWMAALRVVMAGYTNATFVDARHYLGAGANLWDIKAAYDADGVHYNAAGYAALAQAVLTGRVGIP